MESLVSVNCSEQVVCTSPLPTASIWQDILARAVGIATRKQETILGNSNEFPVLELRAFPA
jgi:hypothetical protein